MLLVEEYLTQKSLWRNEGHFKNQLTLVLQRSYSGREYYKLILAFYTILSLSLVMIMKKGEGSNTIRYVIEMYHTRKGACSRVLKVWLQVEEHIHTLPPNLSHVHTHISTCQRYVFVCSTTFGGPKAIKRIRSIFKIHSFCQVYAYSSAVKVYQSNFPSGRDTLLRFPFLSFYFGACQFLIA